MKKSDREMEQADGQPEKSISWPKPGPIAMKDVPVTKDELGPDFGDPDIEEFLHSGTRMTVKEVIGSQQPCGAWLHHDGSISRGNVNLTTLGPEVHDMDIELGRDTTAHPASYKAGAAEISIGPNAQVGVRYINAMTQYQRTTLGQMDFVARRNGGAVFVEHIESFSARNQRIEYENYRQEHRYDREWEEERDREKTAFLNIDSAYRDELTERLQPQLGRQDEMEKNRHMGETPKTLSDRIDELEATRTGAGPSLRDRLHRADAGPPLPDHSRELLIQYDDMRGRTLQSRAKDFLVKHQLVPEAVSQKWENARLEANDRALTAWEASPQGKQWVAEQREEAAAHYEIAKHQAYVERKSEEYALDRGVQLAEDEGIRKHEKTLALEESRTPKEQEGRDPFIIYTDKRTPLVDRIVAIAEDPFLDPAAKLQLLQERIDEGKAKPEWQAEKNAYVAQRQNVSDERNLALEESRAPTLPQKKQEPTRSSSKPKDRDLDMEM